MRKQIFMLVALFVTTMTFAQTKEYQLSTHILDVSEGLPAQNVSIKLEKMNKDDKTWDLVAESKTNKDGRIGDFLPSKDDNNGIYRFTFYTEDYFKAKNIESFYPFIEVVFKIEDTAHYHVPITLSAFGYSTYRGS